MAKAPEIVIPEGYEGYVPPPLVPSQLTPEQQAAMNAGPGFISDLLKMSGGTFALSNDEARDAGAGFIGDLLRAQQGPPPPLVQPVLTSLDPNTAVLGADDITMICNGSGFAPQSVISFADHDEPTTFVSDTMISTGVKPSLGWGEVSVPVVVKNDLMVSETLQFTFTAAQVSTRRT